MWAMDVTDIGLFRLAEQRLAWVDQRQQVLAQNISNADTPDYQPRDLLPFAQFIKRSAAARATRLAVTEPGHLAGRPPQPDFDIASRPTGRAPDGNAVSLQEQLTKVADTDTTQALVLNLYHTYLGMFRTAIDKG